MKPILVAFSFLLFLFLFACSQQEPSPSTTTQIVVQTTTIEQTIPATTTTMPLVFSYEQEPAEQYEFPQRVQEVTVSDKGPTIISNVECYADTRSIRFRVTNRDTEPWSLTHQFALSNRDYKALKINLNGRTMDLPAMCAGVTELKPGEFTLCEKIFPETEWNLWGVRTYERTFSGDKELNRFTALVLGFRQEVVFDCL